MADDRRLTSLAQITSTGALGITDKGFCYSKTNTYPTIGDVDCLQWSSIVTIDPSGYFTDIITGLTQCTDYYVNSYAINSMGISYNPVGTTIKENTGGINNYPTITAYIKNGGIVQKIFEMGTSNSLVVSGETVKNDETTFINGYVNQTSVPIPSSSPIIYWNGYQSVYCSSPNTNPPPNNIDIIFLPMYEDPSSWYMKQDAYQICGNPQYTISATTTIDAVFPFLWVLKSSFQSNSYFNPGNANLTNYFYKDSSSSATYQNGKLVESKGSKSFLMIATTFNKYLSLGYPSYYGSVQYSIDNGVTWGTPTNVIIKDVNTGWLGNTFGIVNQWIYSYNILQYQFPSATIGKPVTFMIQFI